METSSSEEPEERAVFTGYFKDCKRRIDLILVIQDDGKSAADQVRVKFIVNALKLGLELELEPGLMKQHQHLVFVKLHAPDNVVEEQGDIFRIRRYFKDSHVDFVNPGNRLFKYFRRFLPFIFNNYEKEWIKIVRKQYPGAMNYSTLERSLIVYRMLLVLPFGDYENYVGLNRLIRNNLILDAFALHDGPYFFIPNQNILHEVNGRQILFANWVGGGNLLKSQPVSMIQEYLGERIAFYFAFTELYIIALSVLVVAGNIFMYLGVHEGYKRIKESYKTDEWRKNLFDLFCFKPADTTSKNWGSYYCFRGGMSMCPACFDWAKCPFYHFHQVCAQFVFKHMLNTSKYVYFYAILTLWGLVFVLLWKRREYYFRWLWETDDKALSNTYRQEYKIPVSNIKRSKTTGMWTSYESICSRAISIALNLIILGVCLYVVYFLTLFWANFQYDMVAQSHYTLIQKIDVSVYYGIAKTSALYSILVMVIGKVTVLLSRLIAQFENHRHQESYERSVIGRMFVFTFIVTFWYFAFLAFVKGRQYTYPVDPNSFTSPGGIGMMNCTFPSCIDELAITVVVFAFVRFIIFKGILYLLPMTTDYNQGYRTNARIPIWEREYKMTPITEQDIREMFLELTMQFAFITLFSGAFSPVSLFILIANIWDVRYKARLLLVGRRRPLLFKCSGIGAWLTCWEVIAHVAILCNAFMCAYNTEFILKYVHDLLKGRGVPDFYNFLVGGFPTHPTHDSMYSFNTTVFVKHFIYHFKKRVTCMPRDYCRHPGRIKRTKDGESFEESSYVYYIKYYELGFVFLFELCFFVLIWLLPHIIPAHPKDIEETVKVEKRIKTQYYIRKKRIQ